MGRMGINLQLVDVVFPVTKAERGTLSLFSVLNSHSCKGWSDPFTREIVRLSVSFQDK